MTIRNFCYFIATLVIFSCSSTTSENDHSKELTAEQQQVSDLEDQVIAVHDEVMPLMGSLVSLKEQLGSKNSELEASGDSDAKDQVIVNSLVMDKLDQAHEGMMNWMRNYEPVHLDQDPEVNLKYLQEELDKINTIKELTDDAITAAEESLGSN